MTEIYHRKNVTDNLVAYRNEHGDSKIIWLLDPITLWKGKKVPRDSFEYVTKYQRVDFAAVVATLGLNGIGVCMAVSFLVFNIRFRYQKLIRMSSPFINNVIIIGGLVMYSKVFLMALDFWYYQSVQVYGICMIRTWFGFLGFSVAFGAIFSKIWRVHVLFRNKTLQKRIVKDRHLLAMVLVLIVLNSAILIPWTVMYPLQKSKVTDRVVTSGDVITVDTYMICYHPLQTYWYVAQYVYNGLLLFFGTFLAWETRHVSIPVLNDSKYIGFCIYNIVVVCGFGVPIVHSLVVSQVTLRYLIMSLFIIFCTTLVLCIVFIPKVIIVAKGVSNISMIFTNSGTVGPMSEISTLNIDKSNTSICFNSEDASLQSNWLSSIDNTMTTREAIKENGNAKLEKDFMTKVNKLLLKTQGLYVRKVGDDYEIRASTKLQARE